MHLGGAAMRHLCQQVATPVNPASRPLTGAAACVCVLPVEAEKYVPDRLRGVWHRLQRDFFRQFDLNPAPNMDSTPDLHELPLLVGGTSEESDMSAAASAVASSPEDGDKGLKSTTYAALSDSLRAAWLDMPHPAHTPLLGDAAVPAGPSKWSPGPAPKAPAPQTKRAQPTTPPPSESSTPNPKLYPNPSLSAEPAQLSKTQKRNKRRHRGADRAIGRITSVFAPLAQGATLGQELGSEAGPDWSEPRGSAEAVPLDGHMGAQEATLFFAVGHSNTTTSKTPPAPSSAGRKRRLEGIFVQPSDPAWIVVTPPGPPYSSQPPGNGKVSSPLARRGFTGRFSTYAVAFPLALPFKTISRMPSGYRVLSTPLPPLTTNNRRFGGYVPRYHLGEEMLAGSGVCLNVTLTTIVGREGMEATEGRLVGPRGRRHGRSVKGSGPMERAGNSRQRGAGTGSNGSSGQSSSSARGVRALDKAT